jgi:TolA-binding protein
MRHNPLIRWAFLSLAVVTVASGAIAQTSLDERLDERSAKRLDRMEQVVKELRAIVFQGRESGQPVVVQPAETDTQIAALTEKLNDLDHTLARMNGENEIIRHDLDESRRESIELHAANDALKARLAALEQQLAAFTNPPPPPPPPAPAAAAVEAAPTPAVAFANARAMIQAGDAAGAEAALQAFVDKFGDTAKAPEARYLLGRLLLDRGAWSEAATAEIGAIRGWPQTSWAPGAVLDLARALIGLKKTADACQTLDELARRYPKAPTPVVSAAAQARGQARCE